MITDSAPSAAASVGVAHPVSMISTENTITPTIGITSTNRTRSFSRVGTRSAA